jgi:hypothetical protein
MEAMQWFLANTKSEFRGNFKDTALFYSRGMSTVARQMAKSSGLTTIWVSVGYQTLGIHRTELSICTLARSGVVLMYFQEVWPCYLYNHHGTPTNPLRCVHSDPKHQLRFFENMSRAFAIKTQRFGTVLHSTPDFAKPPTDGIWARVEFPALKRGCVQSVRSHRFMSSNEYR